LLISIWNVDWSSGISDEDRKNDEVRKKIASRISTSLFAAFKADVTDMNWEGEGGKKFGRRQSVKAISGNVQNRLNWNSSLTNLACLMGPKALAEKFLEYLA
jgi:hypothetical protein